MKRNPSLKRNVFFGLVFICVAFASVAEAQHMSTRSFTNGLVGSDPNTLVKNGNTITVNLSSIQGTQVYRATLDPYVFPSQTQNRYVIRDGEGHALELLPPRYLSFDATEAVIAALPQGTLTLTVEQQGQGFGSTLSLDVLCTAPAPKSVAQVTGASARFEDGDTMITFGEVNPMHPSPTWTVGEYDDAMEANGPDRSPKKRYRIYRSTVPFNNVSVFATAEMIDEIMPMSGWNGRLYAFDPTYGENDPLEIPMLPVQDMVLASPGSGIYVNRFQGTAPETAYYFVSHTLNGAEDFSSLIEEMNATGPVGESEGTGMTLLWDTEDVVGPWYWTPYVDMTLNVYTRWPAVPDHNLPSRAFNYRLGIPHNTAVPNPPLEIQPHAWGGDLTGWYAWTWYGKGAIMLNFNLNRYCSYTGFHEVAETLRSSADGTVQPYVHARVLDFVYNFVIDEFDIDMNRVIMTGASMGGEAGNFWGMRTGHLFAFIDSAVGNTIPSEYITWEFENEAWWGPLAWQTLYSNPQVVRFGYPEVTPADQYVVWDYYHNPLWLQANPGLDTPYISYGNAPNDGGWEQVWKTTQAMMETKRPFNFTWGQNGHGQWSEPLEVEFVLNQSVPAFGRCSLDDNLGTDPYSCDLEGQINRYLLWDPQTVVDEIDRWEMDIFLANFAPESVCTADVTLRRLQQLEHDPGFAYLWTLEEAGVLRAQGAAAADEHGLITIPTLPFSKTTRRLSVVRTPSASLLADSHTLYARETALVNFTLDAGVANAGRRYILLGSASGTTPGYSLPGGHATLPLNWDVITDLVVLLLNTTVFANFQSTLDAQGQSTAQVNIPDPLPSSAGGAVIHFAYALNAPWNFVSNPVGIEILPD